MKHIPYHVTCPTCGKWVGTRQPATNGVRHPYAVKLYVHNDDRYGDRCEGSNLVMYT